MTAERPRPDQLLARIKTEGTERISAGQRGKLKVFFGYAAGVGKTYSMLQAARGQRDAGVDVVCGYVELHGRAETEALLAGLEKIPERSVSYRGVALREFDIDAALARHPHLILVDELAHTNVPGSRHWKRWQDIEELLTNGIDVYTTVNVQHIESLNDVIAQITGVVVRETVPDAFISQADEVVLVDISPDELLARLREGKVYLQERAQQALTHFFKKENLLALRELSLRATAERVHEDVETARYGVAASVPWSTSERLLVCVGPSPGSKKVIRAAKRFADLVRARWVAVHIETPSSSTLGSPDRERLIENLNLAETLGAEVVTLSGSDVVKEVLEYARNRNVTKIIVGKTEHQRRGGSQANLVARLLQDSGNIDIYFIRGLDDSTEKQRETRISAPRRSWCTAIAALAGASLIGLVFARLGLSEVNIVMVYLVAVLLVASQGFVAPAVVTSFLAVALFDVLFTQPYFSVTVQDTEYLLTFSVMFGVSLLVASLTSVAKREAEISRRSARRIESLYHLNQQITGISHLPDLLTTAEQTTEEMFGGSVAISLPDELGRFHAIPDHRANFIAQHSEVAAAQWTFDNAKRAGRGTDTLPERRALHLPLIGNSGAVGTLSIEHENAQKLALPETRQLLETCCGQIALAIERHRLRESARKAELQAETERMRSALLSSVSHDIRTPLSAITGASSSLLESRDSMDRETEGDLLRSIFDESQKLSRLVDNILQMTRLTGGKIAIQQEWHPLEEVVGSALRRVEKTLEKRKVTISVDPPAALGYFDAILIEQLLINLIDNAVRYSTPESELTITAKATGEKIEFTIGDRGKGLLKGEEQKIFERFFRGAAEAMNGRGTGLGLAICRAIVEAHGGTIVAENREGGGAEFRAELPLTKEPPGIEDVQSEDDR